MFKYKSKQVWWKKYRQRQKWYNIEIILRKAFRKTLKEYVFNCSIAGFWQIWDTKIDFKKRITWALVFTFVLVVMVFYFHRIWNENLSKPLVVSMETSTYPISKIDFPAVAICNSNRISKKALFNFTKSVYPFLAKRNESFSEVLAFFAQLGRLIDFTYNASLRNHPLQVAFHSYLNNSREIVKIMKELAPSCDEMLLKCSWGGFAVDCSKLFRVRRTVHGHCCVFNYILDYESVDRPDRILDDAKQQTRSGLFHGLAVIMDPMIEDYTYPLYNMKGFEVLLFDPTHFADPSGGRVIQRTAQADQTVLIKIVSTKQMATQEVRSYPPSTRKCLFHDERKEKFHSMYSLSACIVNCRIKTVQSLCKCTPYYLPVLIKGGRVCTFDDLKCLNKYKEKLFYLYPFGATSTDGLEIELVDSLICPECRPDCEHTQHYTEHLKLPLTNINHPSKQTSRYYLTGVNLTGKSVLRIYQSTPYGILNRLDIVSYWFEVISNIGGFYGILVGFSIITVPEFLYFFVIRFLSHVYNIFKQ